MKFAVITGVKQAEVHQHDLPEIKPDQVLINNKYCYLCTTDYQQWLGLRPSQPLPMAFGHENAGIAVQIGSDVRHISEGDHVVSIIYKPCLVCPNCKQGLNCTYCMYPQSVRAKPDAYGYYGATGCGDYQIVDAKYVFKVNPEAPLEEAALSEPLATVLHGIRRLRVRTGERVLVIGAGIMGMLNAMVARYYGADVIISEVSDSKLQMAAAMGFEKLIDARTENVKAKANELTGGKPIDAIVIAVGVSPAYQQALDVAPKGCRLLLFAAGYPVPVMEVDPNYIHYQLLEIIGTQGCATSDFQTAVDLIGDRKFDLSRLIEAKYPLEEIQEAFTRASLGEGYRVAVVI